MNNKKTYYILVNSDLAFDKVYAGVSYHYHGAVISRHHTLEAAKKAQALIHREAYQPINTDIVTLHFWIPQGDALSEGYGGANNFHYTSQVVYSVRVEDLK